MCSVSDIPILGKALDQISEATVGAAKREFCYLFYYKDNVNNLKAEFKKLGIREKEIDRKVISEKNDAKKIKDHVVEWQEEVEQINGQVEEFLKKYEERPSWRCFKVMPFPNLYSRFLLGREAVKKTQKVTKLTGTGEDLVTNGEIAFLPPYEPEFSTDYMDFPSRNDAYNHIRKALENKDGSPVLGIYGMPGVGKTTMMEKACKEVKEKGIFNKVVRANVSEAFDLKNVQGQLASCLSLHFPPEANEEERALLLATRLKEEKILVILDDVWKEIPLKKVGIPFGSDGSTIKGCKILFTSRDRNVCKDNNCEDDCLFFIDTLTYDEAWDLFQKNTGSYTIERLDDKSLARNVCIECERLSLVIAAVGKALKRKEGIIWKGALGQLKSFIVDYIERIDQKVYACLKLSFNQLHDDDRLCLLICSMFKEDALISIERLFRLAANTGLLKQFDTLDDARNHVGSIVATLKSSSLLLEGKDERTVKLHDIIRDVARSIAAKKNVIAAEEYAFLSKDCGSQWPRADEYGSRKLIFLSFDSDNVDFPVELVSPDLHTLVLTRTGHPSESLPAGFFNGCVDLRVLWLTGYSMPHFGNLVGNLANLRTLVLEDCHTDFSFSFTPLKNLEMLVFNWSPHSRYIATKLPLNFRGLTRLRMLDLRGNYGYGTILLQSSLSSLCNLEELYFPVKFKILNEETNEVTPIETVLNKLTRLKNLEIFLEDSMSCPNENICKNLVKFKICFRRSYQRREFSAKRSLSVFRNPLEGGVKTLVQKAEEVILENVTGLQNGLANSDGEAFVDLKWLEISHCDDADHLVSWTPQNHINLGQLRKLRVSKCETMEEIIRNIEREDNKEIIEFPKLIHIGLFDLPALTSFYGNTRSTTMESNAIHVQPLFNGMVAFPALRKLMICRIVNFQSIFTTQVIFPNLETLDIDNMDNLVQIWENQYHTEDCFARLKSLSVSKCDKLKSVIPVFMLSRLRNLEELSVSNCYSLVSEVEITTAARRVYGLARLTKLRLRELPKLSKTGLNSSGEIALYPNLTNLDIDICNSMRNVFLPSLARECVRLESLRIKSCATMEGIIAVVGNGGEEINDDIVFPVLKSVELRDLPKLNNLWSIDGSSEANIIQTHSSHKVIFPNLETLDIGNMDNLVQIWENQYHTEDCFARLKSLSVSKCDRLKSVIPVFMLSRLRNLEELSVSNCYSLVSEVEITTAARRVYGLARLTKLRLRELPKLSKTGLNSSGEIALYPNLTNLDIDSCNSMRNVFLPSLARACVHLESLRIESCATMEGIIAAVRNGGEEINDDIVFPVLKRLELVALPKLNNLWSIDGSSEANIIQTHSSHKVTFPILEEFQLYGLMIDFVGQSLRNENHHGTILSFRRLREVTVDDCGLSSLFPCSVLRNLQQLEVLNVGSCNSMEEIFVDEEVAVATTNHMEEISFPRLWLITLRQLRNLRSLCGSANYAFNMPSLESVQLTGCPKMLNFTFLPTRTPRLREILGDVHRFRTGPTSDLNNCIQEFLNRRAGRK